VNTPKGFAPGTKFVELPAPKDFNPPQGYWDCIERMEVAAVQWMKEHPFAELHFNHKLPEEIAEEMGHPGKRVAISAALPDIIPRYALNKDAADFLWALDRASHQEATFLQVQALIDRQVSLNIRKHTLSLPPGDWSCVGCKKQLTLFTNDDLRDEPPPAGALSVCSECGEIAQVNATQNGYEELSKKEFNRLPTSIRKKLKDMQNGIRKSLEQERASKNKVS
jgi:hypothetical protein